MIINLNTDSQIVLNVEDNKVVIKQDQQPIVYTGTVYGVQNIGTGEGLFKEINTNVARFKSIGDGENTQVVVSGDTLQINVDLSQYEPLKTGDDNYVTDEEKLWIQTITGKTDTSSFNAFTGSTETALAGKLDNSYTGHTHNYVSVPVFVAYTGQTLTLINTKLDKSEFITYTGNTQTQLNTKVDKTTFNTYTGDTATALAGKAPTVHTHSQYSLTGHTHTGVYAPALTSDQNYVSDAELQVLQNTSGENSGDQVGDGLTILGTGTEADPFRSAAGGGNVVSTGGTENNIIVYGNDFTKIKDSGKNLSDYSPTGHTHTIANVTGLQTALDGKSATGHTHSYNNLTDKPDLSGYATTTNLNSHTGDTSIHFRMSGITITESQVTGLVADLAGKLPNSYTGHTHSYNNLTDLPNLSLYSLTGHTHTISNVTGLQQALDGKSATGHTHTQYLPFTAIDDTKGITGFVDGNAIAVSYNHTNRTVTLTGDLSYYWRGVKNTITSPFTSTAHAATTGSWYLAINDASNTPVWSQSPWTFDHAMIAYVNYQTTAVNSFCIRETHNTMDWKSHEELHSQVGTYRVSGGQVTAGSYVENTPTDAGNSMGFDAAVLKDEDLLTTVPAWIDGTYTTMYVSGNTSVFSTTAVLPFIATTNTYIQVNNTSTGAMTAGVNGRWYNVYQILMPCAGDVDSQKYRVIMLQPQATYTSLAAAQGEDVRVLALGGLSNLSPEFIVYARITYVTANGDNNIGKCRIASGGITYNLGSKAGQVSVAGFTTNNHQTLSNLLFRDSAHIGAADTLAAFNNLGVAEELPKATFSLSGHTHNQYLLGSEFNNYTGDTQTLIGTKLNTNDFNSYTGATATVLSGKLDNTYTGHTHSYNNLTDKPDLTLYSLTGHTHDYQTLTNKPDLNAYALSGHTHTGVYATSGDLTTHTGDSTIHYQMSGITITESQVTGLVVDLAGKSSTGHTHSEYVTASSTTTFTNKRNTKRIGSITSSATPTINTDNVDMYMLTAQAEAITSFTTNLSGTPTEGQTLWIAITGTGARAITWGTSFEASTIALPTTTVTTARLDVGFVWNTTTNKWRCVAAG